MKSQSIVTTSLVTAFTLLQGVCSTEAVTGYTITDGNTTATYNPTSPSGMSDWIVGGLDQLTSQSFWVRANSETSERSLAGLHVASGQTNASSIDSSFEDPGLFAIDISYQLTDTGPDKATMGESITIRNLSSTEALNISFFQYNNFDLASDLGGDYVRILKDNQGTFNLAQQVQLGFGGVTEEATVGNNPGSVRAEVAYYDTILSKLTDLGVTDLNNLTGTVGPGNVEFAFQWNYTIDPGQSETISKVKSLDVTVIPEPTVGALALLGVGLLLSRRFGLK